MDYVAIDALIEQCASGVAPSTMAAIIKVESAGNPWAIGDNTTHSHVSPKSAREAVAIASKLIASGHNLDLGLAQINSANLKTYGVGVASVFDPCTNVNIGSRILSNFYLKSTTKYGEGNVSLYHALSAYNTGSFYNGPSYVLKILSAAGSKASITNVAWKHPVSKSASYKPTSSSRSPIIAFNYNEPPFPAGSPNQILAINGE